MKALFDFISKLLAALSRAAGDKAEEPDAPTPEKVSTVDTYPARISVMHRPENEILSFFTILRNFFLWY